MKLHKHFYVAMVILALSAGSGEVYFRWLVQVGMGEVVPLSEPLATIPRQLGGWEATDVPIQPEALLKIGAMDTLKRDYTLESTDGVVQLELYIAYFGGVRGTAPHHPDVCMPGAGFHNISNEIVRLKVPGFGDEPLLVHRDVFEHRNGDKKLVVWWEYVHGENVASRTLQRLKWALPAFMGGKRGSVLQVQLLLTLEGDSQDDMRHVTDFMTLLGPEVQRVLPRSES